MALSQTAQTIFRNHTTDLDNNDFSDILTDALNANVLDEVLDALRKAGITGPTEQVTERLLRHYFDRPGAAPNLEDKRLLINHWLNRQQSLLVQTLAALG